MLNSVPQWSQLHQQLPFIFTKEDITFFMFNQLKIATPVKICQIWDQSVTWYFRNNSNILLIVHTVNIALITQAIAM